MVETKCIHVDRAQAAAAQYNSDPNHKLSSDHWQALIALHRTLLHEHHDFFLASQHPSASPALRRLAAKYSMPTRMWRHGISSFLDVLRHSPSDTSGSRLDSILEFLQYARSMMVSLQKSLPSMSDDWAKTLDALQEFDDLLRKEGNSATMGFASDGDDVSASSDQYEDAWTSIFNKNGQYQKLEESLLEAASTSDVASWLPQHMIDTLSGWMYYGQHISPNFNIFTKVFAVLSLATQQCRSFCLKMW